MTSEELYYSFHLLLNENANFRNVKISKGNFVLLFNRSADRWLDVVSKRWNADEEIYNIQSLINSDVKLTHIDIKEVDKVLKYRYTLPNDFFSFIDSHSFVKKDCTLYLTNYLTKPKDKRISIDDDLPSLDYEEGMCNINNNFLVVYAKDFLVEDTYLSYIKTIDKIDLEGYEKLDGTMSKTIHPTLPDIYLNQILDFCVSEVQREFKDQLAFQLSENRKTETI